MLKTHLVYVSNMIGFNKCVLISGRNKLGERGEETFDTRPRDFNKLARYKNCFIETYA